MLFPSRIDAWLLVLLLGAVGLVLWACGQAFLEGLTLFDAAALASAVALGVVLPLWILRRTDYRVDATACHVRCGPFRWTIQLRDIEQVRPTRNPLSSPALSLDRLEIRYRRGRRLLVSPRDKAGFLRAIGQPLQ